MAVSMPTNINYGTVKGQWAKSVLVAPATGDGIPNAVALSALTVTFTPSVTALVDRTATPNPITMVMVPTVCTVDVDGYLLNPEDSTKLVKLIATDDTDVDPHGDWTYHCTFDGAGSASLTPFSFTVPAGSTQDIALIAPVPSSTGISLSQAEAASAAAAAAAVSASASAAAAAASAASIDPATTRKGLAAIPDSLFIGTITRDSNGAATAANVRWPDGVNGTYVGTPSTVITSTVDSYVITYGSPTVLFTYTQPTMTRSSTTGAITARPTIVVT